MAIRSTTNFSSKYKRVLNCSPYWARQKANSIPGDLRSLQLSFETYLVWHLNDRATQQNKIRSAANHRRSCKLLGTSRPPVAQSTFCRICDQQTDTLDALLNEQMRTNELLLEIRDGMTNLTNAIENMSHSFVSSRYASGHNFPNDEPYTPTCN